MVLPSFPSLSCYPHIISISRILPQERERVVSFILTPSLHREWDYTSWNYEKIVIQIENY